MSQSESGSCPRPTLFYDGECGFCNHWAIFVLRRDHRAEFHIAPLQGESASSALNPDQIQNVDSVVFLDEQGSYQYSTAVVRILLRLGRVWWLAGCLLWLVPRPVRDLGYRMIARYRHRLVGSKQACRMPSPEERLRCLP